ncbi:diguanylate cyclase [Lysobacter sp. HA35]
MVVLHSSNYRAFDAAVLARAAPLRMWGDPWDLRMFATLDDIDARYRYRLRLWIARAFAVQLVVVGALNVRVGRGNAAILDAAWIACLIGVLVAIHVARSRPWPGDALVLVNAIFASVNMHVVGLNGLGWVFPIIVTSFAISATPAALVVSLTMLLNAFVLTPRFAPLDATVAFALSGALITLLSYVVARHVERLRSLLGRLALRDPLTEAGNRRAMDDAVRRAAHSHAPAVLAVIDLDHFKSINDAYGHAVGDRVLRETAAVIRDHVLDAGDLYRLGGEEFVVLLGDESRSAASERLHALAGSIRRDVRLREVQVTCSIGFAAKRHDDDDVTWVARADRAMYRAKAAGRDRVVDADDASDMAEPDAMQFPV